MRTCLGALLVILSITPVTVSTQQAPSAPRTLVWVDRAGNEQPLSAPARLYQNPRISPDGRRLGVSIGEQGQEHIWMCDLPACSNLTQFTKLGTTNDIAVWTPDGRRLAFYSNMQGGPAAAYWQMADGSGMPERLTPPIGPIAQQLRAFSPNGQFAAMYHATPATGPDIWLLRLNDRVEFPFLATPAIEGAPRYSPDGNWLAYMSTESGGPQVYVQELPGDRRKRQVSTDGGIQPVWNPKGSELFYRNGSRLMAVPITTSQNFAVGQPKVVFDRAYFVTPIGQTNPSYDISPDGQRFLMIKETAGQRPTN
ncbi:MAG: PD40 domain-containing protein [Acidobacteria bacterium]|nr:PD40 domain-containing protein [Acidobacteriota bacterium]